MRHFFCSQIPVLRLQPPLVGVVIVSGSSWTACCARVPMPSCTHRRKRRRRRRRSYKYHDRAVLQGQGWRGFARKSCLLHNVIPVFHLAESFQRQEDEEAAGGSQAEGDGRLGLASTSCHLLALRSSPSSQIADTRGSCNCANQHVLWYCFSNFLLRAFAHMSKQMKHMRAYMQR